VQISFKYSNIKMLKVFFSVIFNSKFAYLFFIETLKRYVLA